MKKINIIYWNSDNFGDVLNPVLIEELSGIKTQYKNIDLSRKQRLTILVDAVSRFKFTEAKTIVLPWQRTLTAIGSIMSWAQSNSVVWGSGFMNKTDRFAGGKTLAVRGKLTDQKLKEDGFPSCSIYGDPALLLPLWLEGSPEKKYRLGLIPHWKEVDYFKQRFGEKYKIVDLRTRDIQRVVEEITSCEYILSSSLHGIIVGHAYNIPSLWIKHGYIDTDGFKFHDYFSSVDIPTYDGFEDLDGILRSEDSWIQLMKDNKDKTLINNSLERIQEDLLRVAPFGLKDKYKIHSTDR